MKKLFLLLLLPVLAFAQSDFEKVMRYAEQGHANSQYIIGLNYWLGDVNVPQDYAEAAKWFRRAAEQGHDKAQYRLAILYVLGRGVPESAAEAAKWFRRAAEQGHDEAQADLGEMYGMGAGVPQSYAEAYIWLSLAAAQGHEDAWQNRDIYASKLSPSDLSAAQARAAKLFEEIQAR